MTLLTHAYLTNDLAHVSCVLQDIVTNQNVYFTSVYRTILHCIVRLNSDCLWTMSNSAVFIFII